MPYVIYDTIDRAYHIGDDKWSSNELRAKLYRSSESVEMAMGEICGGLIRSRLETREVHSPPSLLELWHDAPRGARIDATDRPHQFAWSDFEPDSPIGRIFMASSPPVIIHEGLFFVPRKYWARFEVVASAEIQEACEARTRGIMDSFARRESRERRTADSSCVYFIQGEPGTLIKIGVSYSAESRMRDLQSGSPVALRILATMPGFAKDEGELHRRFAEHRAHGEWFRPAPELLALIDSLGRTAA